ncbi:hypothetical protein WR25_14859 [Diploscapter pachys]|uniref:Domain of unknown function DB domain-containing protein n=1 Tax=Diploscapter pachys TaxID=2018661 RepID=A0A2A2KNE4_9BILA|nr:hypothetical protein WR25_14859 [Diploscapter pachys]
MTRKILLISLVVLSIIVYSEQCAQCGICGPACGPPPTPAPTCACAKSYGCGQYGCFRMRGSKTYSPYRSRARVVPGGVEADREILRERLNEKAGTETFVTDDASEVSELVSDPLMGVSETVARTNRGEAPVDPNKAFYNCCLDRQLPDACLSKCNFAAFTKESLTAMYFRQDPCPLDTLKEMQFCAAQGRDHTECCVRNGVTTTLAGDKCLLFCDQRIGRTTQLDLTFVPCFDRFENVKACFWHDLTRFYRK